MVPIGSNNSAVCRCRIAVNLDGLRDLRTEESSPEKVGVGGTGTRLELSFNMGSCLVRPG